MNSIGKILKNAFENKLNILTFVTHERAEPNLCLTGHNFYSLTGKGVRQWNTKVAPIPSNYHILSIGGDFTINSILSKLPIDIEFDCIIAQNRFGHVQMGKGLQQHLKIPMISIEHTDTMPNWPDNYIKQLSTLTGDIKVYISEYNKERWMSDGHVIEHMIDTDVFKPGPGERKNNILSMCNDFINRDIPCGFSLWNKLVQNLPFVVIGETPGLSKGLNSLAECVGVFQEAGIFLNTSQFSPIPMSLLEAMACGCAIVSSATCMIPEVIENGVNGFLSNDEVKLRKYLEKLLADPDLARKMGDAARETIIKRFKKDIFLKKWEAVFNDVRNS